MGRTAFLYQPHAPASVSAATIVPTDLFALFVMAMRGALQLSRRALFKIELPEFSKSRFARRYNMMEEDRVKWYNWNLACIFLTAVPPLWMYTVNYRTCEEVEAINQTLNPMGIEKVKYDLRLYGS